MKITGEILHNIMRPDKTFAWSACRPGARATWIEKAELLNEQLGLQTQPLPEQPPQYCKQLNIFRAIGMIDDPCTLVEEQVNQWLIENSDAVIVQQTATMNVNAAGEDQCVVYLLVELPIGSEDEKEDPDLDGEGDE